MKATSWRVPGADIKRWVLLIAAGLILTCLSVTFAVDNYSKGIQFTVCMTVLALLGAASVLLGIKALVGSLLSALKYTKINTFNPEGLSSLLNEKRILVKGPKIVAIGGGTGLSTMLRGLKQYSSNLTALVTVADDGGGSGVLREDLGMLPPGDIRNCILALANTEPIMQQLLQYRFHDGMLKGQSFGNLFLAAMDGISDSFEEAVKKMSDVLAVTGTVLPITLDDVRLCAETDSGKTILGEFNIGHRDSFDTSNIERVYFNQQNVKPLNEAIEAIMEADIVVLGPGSLYTSIIPNLLVDGVCEALQKTKAIIVYVCNVMTQPCETQGYTLSDHIKAIEIHTRKGIIDFCIVNTASIPEELKERYLLDGAELVEVDSDIVEKMGIELITGDFKAINNNLIRHDSNKLAKKLIELVSELVLARDKDRMLDYYYARERLNTQIK
ncbi:putative cofD-like protein [Ruminiclostridium sufflavum DSM 19573]|uniref:Putative gluconeogenesis factor n=1 Tax=Ruminiclostridium sufflavum DSM 19573 TaxID=1121337 RepID=A0A318Y328_9FIRM|nr:YvcK family protein [Ruminiclostridium sufflavum]PYG85876.1 putative cofD-like protein [Ruminiclostridium sufflavum DSM 19573]